MRGKKAKKRVLIPDAKYDSVTVTKLVNYVMQRGQKKTAEVIVYQALEKAADTTEKKPLEVLNKALDNVGPLLEVRSKRIGGANYQIPFEVNPDRRLILALRWIVTAARNGKGVKMSQRLATELLNAYKNEGTAVKKREDAHRMAEANRAFAHFARH